MYKTYVFETGTKAFPRFFIGISKGKGCHTFKHTYKVADSPGWTPRLFVKAFLVSDKHIDCYFIQNPHKDTVAIKKHAQIFASYDLAMETKRTLEKPMNDFLNAHNLTGE